MQPNVTETQMFKESSSLSKFLVQTHRKSFNSLSFKRWKIPLFYPSKKKRSEFFHKAGVSMVLKEEYNQAQQKTWQSHAIKWQDFLTKLHLGTIECSLLNSLFCHYYKARVITFIDNAGEASTLIVVVYSQLNLAPIIPNMVTVLYSTRPIHVMFTKTAG